MAVPAYTEDLTDIDLGQSTTGWVAFGGGGAGLGTGADFAIQSTLALDKQVSSADKGAMHLDATVSLGANDHIIGWIYAATPGILDIEANSGKNMAIGDDVSNFNQYGLEGSDTRPQGGNKPYAVRHITGTPSPGIQTGTPSAAPDHFGGGLVTTAAAKAANLGLDAFRYGTGAYVTAGDGTTPATLLGFATQDEATANKWGLMFRFDGIYQWQGTFAIGQNNSQVATAAHFDDTESAALVVLDTVHSQTDFTSWVIDHASTIFNCSNKTFFVLGTNNRGQVIITNASASSTGWNNCVFNDFGQINGHVNVDYVDCSFNRVEPILQNGGTFDGCLFNEVTGTGSHIAGSNPALVKNCTWIANSSGGVDFGYECDTTGTYNWEGNIFIGAYGGTRGNNPTPGSGSLDAMFYNNSGGLITLNVTGGGEKPSVRNAASSTTVVNQSVDITLTGLIAGSRVFIENTTDTTELFNEIEATTTFAETFNYSSDKNLLIKVRNASGATKYKNFETTGVLTANGYSLVVNQELD